MKNDFDYVREDDPELIMAVKRGLRDRVRELIAEGVDLDVKNRSDNGALYWCIIGNKPDIMRDLLKAGANPDIENEHGRLPLSLAFHHHPKIVLMLMEAGADPMREDVFLTNAYPERMTPHRLAQKDSGFPAAQIVCDWKNILEKRAFRAEKKRATAARRKIRGHGLKRLKR